VLATLRFASATEPLLVVVEKAVSAEIGPREAGALWTALHRKISRLPQTSRRAAEGGFRYLYERPVSLETSDPGVPVIPQSD
jgi:hypothetical protein